MRKPKISLFTIVSILTFICFYSTAFGQQRDPNRGFQFGSSYAAGNFDAVNVSNGNLMVNLPLASLPAGRGTSPGFTVTLQYNSKIWDSKETTYTNHLQQGNGDPNDTSGDYSYASNKLQLSDRGGWKILSDYRLVETNRIDLNSPDPCNGGSINNYNARWKLEMEFPDGSVRQFVPVSWANLSEGNYFNISSGGVRYNFSTQTNPANGLCYIAGSTNQVTTSGMTYMTTDGSRLRLFVPYQSPNWKVYSSDGTIIENSPPDDTTVSQRITDRNGSKIEIKGNVIVDELGRSITLDENGVTVKGVGGESVTTQLIGGYRWINQKYKAIEPEPGGTTPQGTELYDDLHAQIFTIEQIIVPTQAGGQSYTFEYYADADRDYGTNYTDGWGELKSVTLPSGAKSTYTYDVLSGTENLASDILARHVMQRTTAFTDYYDGIETPRSETTLYTTSNLYAGVTFPNGSGSSEVCNYNQYQDFWDNGLAYRSYNADRTTTERIWKANLPNLAGNQFRSAGNANAYVKTELTTLSDAAGQPSLTAIKDFDYDKNGNVTKITEYDWVAYSSVPRQTFGNDPYVGKVTGIPSGASIKRVTFNTYYNQAPNAESAVSSSFTYENASSPKLKNVLKSTEVQNAAGTSVSRSEFYYDDANNKGNLTETRTWDSTKQATLQAADGNGYRLTGGNYVSSSATYNQYGGVITTTDAKGVSSTITYGAVSGPNGSVSDLYPTQTVTASGTSIARTSTAAYDFYTGLPTSMTDVDNNLTSATTYDALGRPIKTAAAVGTTSEIWTQTAYDDVNRRVVSRSDLYTKGDGKKVGTQFYDQLGRVRLTKTLEDSQTQSATNETDGIKVQTRYLTGNPNSYQLTSNPYRAAMSAAAGSEPSMGWTQGKSSNTGKHAETETFAGAGLPAVFGGNNTNSTGIVKTDTDADRTLVTDQAGKQRISRTNALGQLTDVWEITASDTATTSVSFPNQTLSAGYQTSYGYDILNNLMTVSQGGQTRSFSYSSLSRLKSATNPESGQIQYQYDNNGNLTLKTDARSVQTSYVYDALNRVTQRNYANEPNGQTATPNVTYTYDNLPNAKGKLTKVSSSASTTEYTTFDVLGRVTAHKQTTDGNSYTTAYVYNLSGAMTEETYPSTRVVKNVLNNDGDLAIVQSKKNGNAGFFNYAKSFSYTAAGDISSMQLGNGKWESTSYNSRLQPKQIALGGVANATDLLKINYEYGTTANNGNIISQQVTVPTVGTNQGFVAIQNYTYDALNRLKSASETVSSNQTWKQTFKYDRYGNRNFDFGTNPQAPETTMPNAQATSPKVVNPEVLPSSNRFKQDQDGDSVTDYLYDGSGNLTKDAEGKRFVYDANNQQREFYNPSNQTQAPNAQYFYDGYGKRVKTVVGDETTIFVYDAMGYLVAEYTVNAPTANVLPAVRYLTTDTLGSPRITTDQNGKVLSRRDFMPFGEEVFTTQRTTGLDYAADEVRQKFTGYEKDEESGLDYAQARYFNNVHGRFTSVDPLMASASVDEPQSWNRYSYVGNNPLNFTDSTGMKQDECPTGKVCSYDDSGKITSIEDDNAPIHIFTAIGAAIATVPEKITIVYEWTIQFPKQIPNPAPLIEEVPFAIGKFFSVPLSIITLTQTMGPLPCADGRGEVGCGARMSNEEPSPDVDKDANPDSDNDKPSGKKSGGGKSGKKSNEKKKEASRKREQDHREELTELLQQQRTQVSVKRIEKLKDLIKHEQRVQRNSEVHWRKGI